MKYPKAKEIKETWVTPLPLFKEKVVYLKMFFGWRGNPNNLSNMCKKNLRISKSLLMSSPNHSKFKDLKMLPNLFVKRNWLLGHPNINIHSCAIANNKLTDFLYL